MAALALSLAAASGCGDDAPSILEPASRAGDRVAGLWWVLFWISVVAVAVVFGFLAAAILRRHRAPPIGGDGEPDDHDDIDRRPVPWGGQFVVLAGIVVTGAILAGTFILSVFVLDDLAAPADERDMTVEVVARTWWWDLRYPDGVVTANEIHIPVGQRVTLLLPTADVIHSFWVPELQVKEDHVPGRVNELELEADRAGRYQGQCAEFCGLQHAHMRFQVVAQPPDEFEDWLADQARPADEPETALARRGRDTLEAASCAGCHTVRGTSADGDLGPDLTHLADRQTIGAGVARLTPETLVDFIANAQDDKPGATMPPTELTPAQVRAVAAYLLELE